MIVKESFLLINYAYSKYMQALTKRVERCYQSMEEVLKDLERLKK